MYKLMERVEDLINSSPDRQRKLHLLGYDNPEFVEKKLKEIERHDRNKTLSNADKIRYMSDEELAEWLDKLITHCNDGPCFNCFMQKACLTSMLDWLRQEAQT